MPLWALRFFLTLSLLIKSAIFLLLPFIIWGLLFSGMNQIVKKKNGLKLLFLLIPVVCFSNFLTSWFAYFSGFLFVSEKYSLLQKEAVEGLLPFYQFDFPVLEQHFGFSTEMLSMITAMYIIFDPVITGVNVAGNNAFAILFDKLSLVFMKRKSDKNPC